MADEPHFPGREGRESQSLGSSDIDRLYAEVSDAHDRIDRLVQEYMPKNYVAKETFAPVQRLVYGLAGLILGGFATTMISLVISSVGK